MNWKTAKTLPRFVLKTDRWEKGRKAGCFSFAELWTHQHHLPFCLCLCSPALGWAHLPRDQGSAGSRSWKGPQSLSSSSFPFTNEETESSCLNDLQFTWKRFHGSLKGEILPRRELVTSQSSAITLNSKLLGTEGISKFSCSCFALWNLWKIH